MILNTSLSLRRFSTDHKLLLNDTLRGCFSNAKLIGAEDVPESLQNYSNQVMNIFVNDQLAFFPDGQLMIDAFIIQYGGTLDIVIINNIITISEMPVVQLLALLIEHDAVLRN